MSSEHTGGRAGQRVIDADGHVLENDAVWSTYLDPGDLDLAPRWVVDNEGRQRRCIAGELAPFIPFPQANYASEPPAGCHDPGHRLEEMTAHGIDVSVIFPSAGLHFASIANAVHAARLCRAYNRWLADFCSLDRQRLVNIAVVPQQDMELAVAEVRYAVGQLGSRGVMLRPNPINGHTLDHPIWEPMWYLLEELDVPAVIHEATTMNVPEAGTDRYTNYLYLHAISHPHEHQMASLALICGGVLESHPDLRVAFVEAGCGWVPYWLERLDQHVKYWGNASRTLSGLPSDYFRRQCFVTPFADEAMLPSAIELLGVQSLVFSSDYPFPYTTTERIADALITRTDVNAAAKTAILSGNAMRLYGLDAARP